MGIGDNAKLMEFRVIYVESGTVGGARPVESERDPSEGNARSEPMGSDDGDGNGFDHEDH